MNTGIPGATSDTIDDAGGAAVARAAMGRDVAVKAPVPRTRTGTWCINV